MNNERLKSLLEAAALGRLTEAEATELARLLEIPANLELADRELAALKHRIGAALDYHYACKATEPQIPAARLEALLATVAIGKEIASSSTKVVPIRRWVRPVLAAAAMAACVSLLFWYQRPDAPKPSVFEFGIVATTAPVRGEPVGRESKLGSHWKVVTQENLASLRAWSAASLPKEVTVRVWVDEEAGKLRAVHRRSDGTIATAERTIETRAPIVEQVERFAAQLGSTP